MLNAKFGETEKGIQPAVLARRNLGDPHQTSAALAIEGLALSTVPLALNTAAGQGRLDDKIGRLVEGCLGWSQGEAKA